MRFKDLKDSDFEYTNLEGKKYSLKKYYEKIFQKRINREDFDITRFKIKLELEVIEDPKATEKNMFTFFASEIIAEVCNCYFKQWEIKDLEITIALQIK